MRNSWPHHHQPGNAEMPCESLCSRNTDFQPPPAPHKAHAEEEELDLEDIEDIQDIPTAHFDVLDSSLPGYSTRQFSVPTSYRDLHK